MRTWKNVAAGVLLIPVVMTGCAGTKETALDPKNPVTITVWNYYTGAQQESFNELVGEFNETKGKELGITVKAVSEGGVSDLEEHVMAAANKEVGAEEMPNVFMAYADVVYELDQMGLIEDLSPYLTEEEREEYVDSYLEEGEFAQDGGLKIFPVAKATEVFFLNKTDWDAFASATGVTMDDLDTVEGVVETAKTYYEWTDAQTETKDDGKALFGRDSMGNYMINGATQLGQPLFTKEEDGTVTLNFDKETVQKLWDCYYVPYINGYFAAEGRFRSDDVKTGTIISFVGSSAGATFFPSEVFLDDDTSYSIETTIVKAPQFKDGVASAVQQGAGMAVSTGEPAEVEASVAFLKWFTDTEQNIQFSVESGYLPVKKEANDIEVIKQEVDEDEATMNSISVAIDTLKENHDAYTPAMKNGNTIRNILEYAMSDQADEDRKEILADMEDGMSREAAVAKYDTEEHFTEWYDATKTKLEEAMQ